jgi:hypothetical protein
LLQVALLRWLQEQLEQQWMLVQMSARVVLPETEWVIQAG